VAALLVESIRVSRTVTYSHHNLVLSSSPSLGEVRGRPARESRIRGSAYLVVVDRNRYRLHLWKRRLTPPRQYRLVYSTTISLGAEGYETPYGVYYVQARARYPEWKKPNSEWVPEDERGVVIPGDRPDDPHPENPLKEAFLKLTDDGVGIHGTADTSSLGDRRSHGCIRVRPHVARDLHDRVRGGTPVVIF
jgi:lipoprotein-anchoring transpeptidase ErfK/SrfK